jgi:sarcosine oxidase subunit alpha
MSCRLNKQPLEWIDRRRPVSFHFEGRLFKGFACDSISSALWASEEKLLGRSFKYHRPRGLLSCANHDINVLLENDEDTHIRGDVTPLVDGMSLYATNTRGGLLGDRNRWLGRLAVLLPVGFYYKAFHTPRRLFPLWERIIRNAAGLGRVRTAWQRRITPKWYEHADILVVGAGPSGMQAALHAAEQGLKVILAEENPVIGGSLDYQWANDLQAAGIRSSLKEQVLAHPLISVKTQTVAAGYYADHWIPLAGPRGIAKTRVKAMIVATGLLEQPAVFHNNDLPGVMLMSGAQRLIVRYAVKPGHRAVLLVANEEGYRGALDLLEAGVEIPAIADLGKTPVSNELLGILEEKGLQVLSGYAVYEARGKNAVSSALLAPIDAEGRCDLTRAECFACDAIIMSVGWSPAAHLLYQAGGRLGYDADLGQIVPRALPEGIFAAGRVNGVFALEAQLRDGDRAAASACAELRGEVMDDAPEALRDRNAHSASWPIVAHPDGKNFIDFDEDLQLRDLENAAREGFDNIELLKRFSTVGMGPSQGKHANMNAIRVLSRILGQGIDETGSTTARPFYHPQRLDDLAGRRFRVHRSSALHEAHVQSGAVFMEAGAWLRPEFYGDASRRETLVREEVMAVRHKLGLIDVSTLGKIEVLGPDAVRLLHAAYTMRMDTLKLGMTRYALMVDESGVIVDDGLVGRLGENRYYVTTTTSHADATYRTLSRCVVEWRLNVRLVNRTGQMAAMNLAGPCSRELLAGLTDIDLDEQAFPYLGIREGMIGDIPARLMRVGFVGELGYEIHVPYGQGLALWQLLMREGSGYGIRPFGVEAQRRLRLEKGHVIVGQDTDGLTTPYEAAMPWAVHLQKAFFIGQKSLQILKPETRRILVGFQLAAGHRSPEVLESHLVIHEGEIGGRVTSVAFSPTLGRLIGMAMVDMALAAVGQSLSIRTTSGEFVEAEQVAMPFYDPDGLRQKPQLEMKKAG